MAYWRWFITSGFIALSLTSCFANKSTDELAKEIEPSVVLITYADKSGHGTGFFVQGAKGVCTILTAAHVVTPSSNLLVTTDDHKLWKSSQIQQLPNLDLAVVNFKLENSLDCPYKSLRLGDSDRVKIGERIRISGYPERTGEGQLVKQFPGGEVTNIAKPPLPEGYAISYDATAVGGMSGAPVVNFYGEVIAVHGKTDAEIVSLARNQQSSLSSEQKELVEKINNRVESVARINHFKWGVPIKIYLANVPLNVGETVNITLVMLILIAGFSISIILINIMFIQARFSRTEYSGEIAIIGPRPSGKLVFLVTLAYFPNVGNKNSPVKSVETFGEDSENLVAMAKDILTQGFLLPPMHAPHSVPLSITIKPQFNLTNLVVKKDVRLNLRCTAYPGELIEELKSLRKDNNFYWWENCINNYTLSSVIYLAVIIDCMSKRDQDHSQSFANLERRLSQIVSSSIRKEYRIAVIFAQFDKKYAYKNHLDKFIDLNFPRTKAVFEDWKHTWGCSVAYFACSAYGMIGNPPEPNAFYQNYEDDFPVLADSENWKPFGLVAPIYWLVTGKHDKRLLD